MIKKLAKAGAVVATTLALAGSVVSAANASSPQSNQPSSYATLSQPDQGSGQDFAPAACRFGTLAYPLYANKQVYTHSYSSGCHQWWEFRVTIQRSRWYGWEDLSQKQWRGGPDQSYWIYYRCTYNGIHDFRTLSRGTDHSADWSNTFASQKRRYTCRR